MVGIGALMKLFGSFFFFLDASCLVLGAFLKISPAPGTISAMLAILEIMDEPDRDLPVHRTLEALRGKRKLRHDVNMGTNLVLNVG